jgi:hypothetical protein
LRLLTIQSGLWLNAIALRMVALRLSMRALFGTRVTLNPKAYTRNTKQSFGRGPYMLVALEAMRNGQPDRCPCCRQSVCGVLRCRHMA